MNHFLLLNGLSCIENYFLAESLEADEAINVANLSLDILIAYKIENVAPSLLTTQCISDYLEIFFHDHKEYLSIQDIIYQKKVSSLNFIDLENLKNKQKPHFIFQKLYLLGLECNQLCNIDIFGQLVISLNQGNYDNSLIYLLAAKLYINSGRLNFTDQEKLLIKQTEEYLKVLAKSTNNSKLIWQWKVIESLKT